MATDTTYSESYGQGRSSSAIRVVERRWIKLAEPIWPFFWRGLLPLLGLLLLAWLAFRPFAKHTIESTVMRETTAHLAEKGQGWAKVAVSGQDVTLSGTQPKPGDGDAALATARAALCPSWAGRLTCAVSVKGNFDTPAAAAPAPAPVAAPAPAAPSCQLDLAQVIKEKQIKFATGKATISAESASVLDELAQAAKKCPGTDVIAVEGHTDSVGAVAANKALSQARADAVVAALASRGIAKEQLRAEGFGPDQPIASNDTAEGKAQNRRIEFRVTPK